MKTIAVDPLQTVAAVRDVEGARAGGNGADGPVHTGGVEYLGRVEAEAIGVVACEGHDGIQLGRKSGSGEGWS